ncbi:MAG: acyltransferase [Actinomycetota bacterium]|nr:acyltransferase [Actinomycetota bacterium]
MRRLDHLDALRSGAMLVVVLWHVTVLWMFAVPLSPGTMSAIQWPMALSRWSLPLFFLMAGFFGAALLERWGERGFVADRLKRIALPLGVGLVTIVPLSDLVLDHFVPRFAGLPLGPLHLWFLWYLLLFYAVGMAVLRLPGLAALRRSVGRLLRSRFAAPALALATTALLVAGDQLPSPAGPWIVVPHPGLTLFYGSFFAVGLLVHGIPGGVGELGKCPWLNAALALAVLAPAVLLRDGPIWLGPGAYGSSPRAYLWLAAFCLLAWSAVFAICGFAQRRLTGRRPAVRYVADSSYWVYLAHFPLVPPLILLVAPHAPFPVAWLVVVTLLFSILLGVYELVVRHSVVGRVLNGPRSPRGWGPWRPGRARSPEGASG